MFNQLGWPEIMVLLLIGLFVFGPDRLPGMAADAGRALRSLRTHLKGITEDLRGELGPEVGDLDLASLNPRTFVRRHLLEDDDDDDLVDQLAGRPAAVVVLQAGEPAPWDPDTT